MFMPSARRPLFASPLFSEGASHITQDIAVLYIFKGCCASGAGSYERKERKRRTLCIRTLYYVQHWRHCACVRCCSFNLGNGETGEDLDEKKFIARDAVRHVNPHNALFTLVPCVTSESAEIVSTHIHFRRCSKKVLLSLFSIRLFALLSPLRERLAMPKYYEIIRIQCT